MVHAVVMVETGTAKSTEILDEITSLERVLEAHVVAGDYDIIAEVEAEAVGEVMSTVATAIRDIDGIDDTRTYVCLG